MHRGYCQHMLQLPSGNQHPPHRTCQDDRSKNNGILLKQTSVDPSLTMNMYGCNRSMPKIPEAELISSTSIKPVRRKLKKIFATHGVPPFNSKEFQAFAAEMGFKHRKVTPKHPKAQGQVEGFNKLVNKTATIANQEGMEVHEATHDMLHAYRDTPQPHPATKKTPYELMMNREVWTKLDSRVAQGQKKAGFEIIIMGHGDSLS